MKKYELISNKNEKNIHYFETIEDLRDSLATDSISALTGIEILRLSQGCNIETKVCKINIVH